MTVLGQPAWQACAAAHRARLTPVVEAHLDRRSRGIKHPVLDFLFEYYAFPPHRLLDWHPGWGVTLQGPAASDYLVHPEYAPEADGVALAASRFPATRRAGLDWVCSLLTATAQRPPRFSCLGLHEWAMVYRAADVRHAGLPLRMEPDALAAFVESQELCCSHYDAFRFFTPAAAPRNRLRPDRRTQQDFDQPGCLHANMDLYKWCFKFHPWIGSDLLADAFLLAVRLRELDMAASPYDVRSLGYAPVPIETAVGRAEYVQRQRELADEAGRLRDRLLAHCGQLTSSLQEAAPSTTQVPPSGLRTTSAPPISAFPR